MFKFILMSFIPLLLSANKPTEVSKEFMKETLKEVKSEYKYSGEQAKMIDIYLDDYKITHIMEVDYLKQVHSNPANAVFQEKKEDMDHKKMRKISTTLFSSYMRSALRNGLCADANIRNNMRGGFTYVFKYKWNDRDSFFLNKEITEEECIKVFDNEK